jgi:filamentous hemagglutinin family protein
MMTYQSFNHSRIISIFILLLGLYAQHITLSKLANAQVIPDSTLGDETSIVTPNVNIKGTPSSLIDGGAVRGINLFHSFQDFNVLDGQGVYFNNPQNIRNIISRVTGSPSYIKGVLGVWGGDANLFLINPHGIIFGKNAFLDLGGSFVATTAHAIQFENLGFFDALNPNSPPLLTINPSGFLFSRSNIAPIINLSKRFSGQYSYFDSALNMIQTVNINGLKVPDEHSLLLLGGNIFMNGSGLYALGGKVSIGSVVGEGLVELDFDGDTLNLAFPSNIERGDISFTRGARVDASGNNSAGGSIHLTGKNFVLKDRSQVISLTTGQGNGGAISIDATGVIKVMDDAPLGTVSTISYSSGSAGDIRISARGLLVNRGAQIISSTFSSASGGNITINATDFVFLRGSNSGVYSATGGSGSGGNISIKTSGNIFLRDEATILSGAGRSPVGEPTSGSGGDIDIVAEKSIQIANSSVSASHFGKGKAGNININTQSLQAKNARIDVFSDQGQAGNLTINADSFLLDGSALFADTGVSGANIILKISNILRIKNESLISATANGNADGGNIVIDTPILLALPPTGANGSDIVAKAISGAGGNIIINAQSVFGIEEREALDDNQTNDIDASSQFGRSGQVLINTTTDPNQGLIEIPTTVVDPNSLVAQNPCKKGSESEFTRSGRGGLPTNPTQNLGHDTTQVNLVEPSSTLKRSSAETQRQIPSSQTSGNLPQSQSQQKQIAPAQGWVYDEKGDVVLVAYNPNVISPPRIKQNPACPVQ